MVGLGQTGLGEAILDGARPEWIRLGRARLGWAKGSCVQSHSPGGLTLVDAEPIFGSAVATQGSETWNLGVGGGLDPPEEGRASGPCIASAASEILGETKPPCPGRAFSLWGCPGAGAPRKVSPPEPQPHQSAGCSALGPARPLKNCRLWATVRIKRATDPLAMAPTLGGPSPHPLGPQLLGPYRMRCRGVTSPANYLYWSP